MFHAGDMSNVFAGRFNELFDGVCLVFFYSCSGGDRMTKIAIHGVLDGQCH